MQQKLLPKAGKWFTTAHIESFQLSLLGQGLSQNTALAYSKDLKSFLEAAGGKIKKDEFSQSATYWLTVSRMTLAPKTVGRHLTSLKSFARWAGIKATDLQTYHAPKPLKANPHPLPEGIDGVYKMLDVCTDSHEEQAIQSMIALCGLVGLRISEALSTRASMFNDSDMTLTIRGKGDKTRIVPVSPSAWKYLEYMYCWSIVHSDAVFCSYADRVARDKITKLGERAGLARRVSSHDLRATFATVIYQRTKDIRAVQELLGHTSVATTQVYLGVDSEVLKTAVGVL